MSASEKPDINEILTPEFVKSVLKERGVNQKTFAKSAGWTDVHVSRLLTEKTAAPFTKDQKIRVRQALVKLFGSDFSEHVIPLEPIVGADLSVTVRLLKQLSSDGSRGVVIDPHDSYLPALPMQMTSGKAFVVEISTYDAEPIATIGDHVYVDERSPRRGQLCVYEISGAYFAAIFEDFTTAMDGWGDHETKYTFKKKDEKVSDVIVTSGPYRVAAIVPT